ncbi:MAG: YbaK/EbsC family protein [Candidatus Aenigmatarchaeota archaeon]
MKKQFKELKKFLDENNVKYFISEHEPVYTSEQAAKVRGVELKTGVKALIFKVLAEKPYFIHVLIPGDKRADINKIKNIVGHKTKLASSYEVLRVCGCEIGSVHPFGNLFNLGTYMDKKNLENEFVNFNAGLHTISIRMSSKDMKKLINPVVGDFCIDS